MWKRLGKDGARYWGSEGAGIFFTNGDKVLLLKRSDKGDGAGTWGLPGGKLEDGESPIDAAQRESKEECGKFKGQRVGEIEEKDGLHKWTTYFFRIEKPFKCKLSDEHTEYKWTKIEDIKSLKLHPKFSENLNRHLKTLRSISKKGTINFKEWLETFGS